MLVIRLARTGRNKYPTYRIVSAESARAATGKHIEVLGHYNPHTKELVLDKEAIAMRLSQGAQPSNTVVKLLLREKMELPKWVVFKTKAAKVVPVAEVVEAPAEIEVSEAEAAADAGQPRVAEVTEEAAAEAGDAVPNTDETETAATEEAESDEAVAADDTAADAATAKSAE